MKSDDSDIIQYSPKQILSGIKGVLGEEGTSDESKLHGIEMWLKFNSQKIKKEFIPDIRNTTLGRFKFLVNPNAEEVEEANTNLDFITSIAAKLRKGNSPYKNFTEHLFMYYSLFLGREPDNKTNAIRNVFRTARKINGGVKLPDERTAIRTFDKLMAQSKKKLK